MLSPPLLIFNLHPLNDLAVIIDRCQQERIHTNDADRPHIFNRDVVPFGPKNYPELEAVNNERGSNHHDRKAP
jgi:hypothetical protein